MASAKRYWLLKSEPDCFSIDDLAACPKRTTHWEGVRNYQARNFIRDDMHVGDGVLFYHSSCKPSAIVGTAKIVREAYPDFTAMVASDPHYDPKSTPENPIWMMVDIQHDQTFAEPLPLELLKKQKGLAEMELLRRGSRLSVQPVTKEQYETVLRLAQHLDDDSKPDSTAAASKKKSPPAKQPETKSAKSAPDKKASAKPNAQAAAPAKKKSGSDKS